MMHTFLQISRQEIVYWFRKPSTYIYFLVLLALAMQDIYESSGKGGASGEIYLNAPVAIYSILNRYSLWLTFLAIVTTANTVNRDHELGVDKFYYALPLSKPSYLLGKFFGALLTLVFLASAIGLGILIVNLYLFHSHILSGSFNAITYLKGYGIMIIPNLFIFSAISFALVTLTRNIFLGYTVIILSFIGFLISSEFLRSQNLLPTLIDPFGTIYLYQSTYNWNIYEQNNLTIPVSEVLIINRVIWLSVGLTFLAVALYRFEFKSFNPKALKRKDEEVILANHTSPAFPSSITFKLHVRQMLYSGWFEFTSIAKSKAGLLSGFMGISFLIILLISAEKTEYSTTFLLTENTNKVFKIFMYMLVTFLSSELVWRRKNLKVSDLFDVLPVHNWIFLGSITVVLCILCLVFLSVFFIAGIMAQTFNGYYHYQPGVYINQLFLVFLPDYLLFGFLSLFFQVMIRNKYLSLFAIILFWIAMKLLNDAGFDFPLYHFKYFPTLPYSDLNRYGHFLEAHFWFLLLWFLVAGLLWMFCCIFWNRERDLPAFANIRKTTWYGIASLSTMILCTSGFIYFKINIQEKYPSEQRDHLLRANYEKKYKKYEHTSQPEIAAIKIMADLYTSQEYVSVDGEYILKNRTSDYIDTLHVTLNPEVHLLEVQLNETSTEPLLIDQDAHRYMYILSSALAPGDSISFKFKLEKGRRGFGLNHKDIVGNGTFIPRSDLMPSIINYSSAAELSDNEIRKKFGLLPKDGLYPRVDSRKNSGKITNEVAVFEAIISTSKDQTAITKGQLINSWEKQDRKYFHYKTSSPTSAEYALFSGKYLTNTLTVALGYNRSVQLDIYYHHTHDYNIEMMMNILKEAICYYDKNFGEYHSSNLRVVEVPGFHKGARSFPETIAFYENSGFLHNQERNSQNWPAFTIAHECAHQWFGSQKLVRQPAKGITMVNETLAQYAALMVLKINFGIEEVRQWLNYNIREYLLGHLNDANEIALKDVEDQNYIYYHKGAIAMYSLQEHMGESNLNNALAECITANSGKLTNTSHLLKYFRTYAPDSAQHQITDLFEKVIIFDNILESASYDKVNNNEYALHIKLTGKKYSANNVNQKIPFSTWMVLEIRTEKEVTRRKIKIISGINRFLVILQSKPISLILDPHFNFPDKTPGNNKLELSGDLNFLDKPYQ